MVSTILGGPTIAVALLTGMFGTFEFALAAGASGPVRNPDARSRISVLDQRPRRSRPFPATSGQGWTVFAAPTTGGVIVTAPVRSRYCSGEQFSVLHLISAARILYPTRTPRRTKL